MLTSPDTPETGSVAKSPKPPSESVSFLRGSPTCLPPSRSHLPALPRRCMARPGEKVDSQKPAYCARSRAASSPRRRFSPIGKCRRRRRHPPSPPSPIKRNASLDQLKSATAALADPAKRIRHAEKTTPPPAPSIISMAAHSDETAPPNPSRTRLRLAVSESTHDSAIRENLVVLINPVFQSRRPRQSGPVVSIAT